VTAYNVAFLTSFPLCALAAHALVFTLVRRHDAATVGGLAFGFSPYRMAQLAHIQILWLFGAPAALAGLHLYRGSGRARWLALFAAAWLALALANGYILLGFPLVIGLWIAWYVRDIRQLITIAAVWVVSTLPLLPILAGYQHWQSTLGLGRHFDEIERFSADLTSIVTAAPIFRFWHGLHGIGTPEGQLFPGAVVL